MFSEERDNDRKRGAIGTAGVFRECVMLVGGGGYETKEAVLLVPMKMKMSESAR